MAATVIEELLIKLGVDSKEVDAAVKNQTALRDAVKAIAPVAEKAFGDAEKSAKSYGESAKTALSAVKGGLESVVGVVGKLVAQPVDAFKWVNEGVEALDKVAKSSRATGVAAEDLQRLQFVASQSGVSAGALSGGVSKLNKSLSDVAFGGGKQARNALALLALTVQDLAPLGTAERLQLIGERINLLGTDALKSRARIGLFGSGGNALASLLADPGDIAETAGQASVATNAQVAAAEKLSDAIGLARNRVKGFALTLLSDLVPLTKQATDAANAWLLKNREWINERIHVAVKTGADAFQALLPTLSKAADDVSTWAKANENLLKTLAPRLISESVAGFLTLSSAIGKVAANLDDLRLIYKSIGRNPLGLLAAAPSDQFGALLLNETNRVKENDARKPFVPLNRRAALRQKDDTEFDFTKGLSAAGFNADGSVRYAGDAATAGRGPQTAAQRQYAELVKSEYKRQQDDLIKQRQAKAIADQQRAKTPRAKKAPAVKSRLPFDEVLEDLYSGRDVSDIFKSYSKDPGIPSSKAIKPTVAIDFYNFVVTQNITGESAKEIGDRSAQGIETAFRAGKRKFSQPVGNLVR